MGMYTRKMLDDAYAEADAMEARVDTLLCRLEQKEAQKARRQVIYKTVVTPRPEPQAATTMDAATEAKWNEWAISLIRRHCEAVITAIAEANAETEDKLRDEIAALRVDLEILKAWKQNKITAGTKVTPIRGRNAA
jgi:hypothetical protein